MADDQGKGWHGDTRGHQDASKASSGNQGNPQHAEAGHKGGKARANNDDTSSSEDMGINSSLTDEDL